MAPRPRQARFRQVVRVERLREAVEQPPHLVERLEHCGVPRGVRVPPFDDVTPVLAVDARGAEEGFAAREGVPDAVFQFLGGVTGEFDRFATNRDDNRFALAVD